MLCVCGYKDGAFSVILVFGVFDLYYKIMGSYGLGQEIRNPHTSPNDDYPVLSSARQSLRSLTIVCSRGE